MKSEFQNPKLLFRVKSEYSISKSKIRIFELWLIQIFLSTNNTRKYNGLLENRSVLGCH